MAREIHLVVPFTKYRGIIDSITGPMDKWLQATISDQPKDGALNVLFFLEGKYRGVFLPHGVADKEYRTPERAQQMEALLYSGEMWRAKAIADGIAPEQVRVVGWPKLDPIFKGQIKRTKKTVLWAPTHNAIQETSSWPTFAEDFQRLGEWFDICQALHPAKEGTAATLQALAEARVVLADTGSIAYEALALGKPVILLAWLVDQGRQKGTFEEQLYADGICQKAKSYEHLAGMLTAGDFGITPKGKDLAAGIIDPATRGKAGRLAGQALRELAAK